MYVEVDGGVISIADRCLYDLKHWGNCAIIDRHLVEDSEDMCFNWYIEDHMIKFRNAHYSFDRSVDEIKVNILEDPPDAWRYHISLWGLEAS